MCLMSGMPKVQQPQVPDPNAAANAATAAEIARRRNAMGFGSTFGAGAGTTQPSLARKTLYGE